jgi:predicted oxidoreductase
MVAAGWTADGADVKDGEVKTQLFGPTGLTVPAVVLGMMRIPSLSEEEIRSLVAAAIDAGVTFFDHADIYGPPRHECERRFGDAVRLSPAEREQVWVQSKVGIRPGFYDFSADHILRTVEESLSVLRLDHLDVLLLHRPDTLVEPEEVARAFEQLHAAGKVRHFGVSNHTPGQIDLLRRYVAQPLVANQVQFSITHANLVAAGVAANVGHLDQAVDRGNGILDHARLHDITLQAWSPYQRGGGAPGVLVGDRENLAELNDVLDDLASAHGVTPTGIATAWITRHPANIQVVLGTTKASRVQEAAAGADVALSREEWYRIFRAAGHALP